MFTTLLFLVFIVLMLLNVPIAIAMVASTLLVLFLQGDFNLYFMMQKMVSSLLNPTLMAIPGFIFSGVIMARGGIARYLIDFANAWIGHFRGGLSIVTVLVCMIFASISGSSPATAAAIGSIAIPGMLNAGYDKKYAMGLVAAAGTLGILIPPSIPMVLYGVTAEESIGKLFAAGMIPGILMGLILIVTAVTYARKNNYGGGRKYSWSERWQATVKAIPGLLLPVIILGTIYTGVATPTESSVIASAYALIVSIFIYRELRVREFCAMLKETVSTTSMIYLIISAAGLFGLYLTNERIPNAMAEWIAGQNLSLWMFYLIILVMFFIMGMFLEAASIILITLPILLPIMKEIGIDPIHFAIVMTISMELAQITPPVGLNLFVVSGVAKEPIGRVVQGVIPFIIIMMLVQILLIIFPLISLYLPNLLFK
jgi:C4-dicarboxylate transporter DctM subunit